MKKILGLILLLFTSTTFAQIDGLQLEDFLFKKNDTSIQNYDHSLKFDFDYSFNSNSITNSFIKGMMFDKFITEAQKNDVIEKLSDKNIVGFDASSGLTYKWTPDSSDVKCHISFKVRNFLQANFNRSAFQLIFQGNSQFAGENVIIDPFDLTEISYQQILAGYEKSFDNGLTAGVEFSMVRGSKFQQINIAEGELYTEADGVFLDYYTDFELAQSDPEAKFSDIAGFGATIGFYGNYQFENGDQLAAEFRDIGIVSWMGLTSYHANNSYRFDGVEIDILDFSDSLFTDASIDSLSSILGVPVVEKSVQYMPATINFRYLHNLSENTGIGFGYRYITNANFKPQYYMLLNQRLPSDFSIGSTVSFGGYSNIDISLSLAKKIASRYVIYLDAYYLEPLIASSKTTGQAIKASLLVNF